MHKTYSGLYRLYSRKTTRCILPVAGVKATDGDRSLKFDSDSVWIGLQAKVLYLVTIASSGVPLSYVVLHHECSS